MQRTLAADVGVMPLNPLPTFQRSAGARGIRENIFRRQAPPRGRLWCKNRMSECICVFLRRHNRGISDMFVLRGNLLLRALPVLHCAIYNRSRGTFSFRQYVSQLIRFRFRIFDNSYFFSPFFLLLPGTAGRGNAQFNLPPQICFLLLLSGTAQLHLPKVA